MGSAVDLRTLAIAAFEAAARAQVNSLKPQARGHRPGFQRIQMQDQSISRALPARHPLYPPRMPEAPPPPRRARHPEPELTGLSLEMLRAIVIEQIG